MKYTINISQDMGNHQEANIFLSDVFAIVFKLLEQKGLKFPLSKTERIAPEILEKLILGGSIEKEKSTVFAKNRTANAILSRIDQTGGLDGKGEEIRELGQGFRKSFEFKHDRTL
jgi:hypothetical protein